MKNYLFIVVGILMIASGITVPEQIYGARCDRQLTDCHLWNYGGYERCATNNLTTHMTYEQELGETFDCTLYKPVDLYDECGHSEIWVLGIWFPLSYQCGGNIPDLDCG